MSSMNSWPKPDDPRGLGRKTTYPALYGVAASKRMADECLERAAAALAAVSLADSRLLQIGRWIVKRSN